MQCYDVISSNLVQPHKVMHVGKNIGVPHVLLTLHLNNEIPLIDLNYMVDVTTMVNKIIENSTSLKLSKVLLISK